VDLGELVMPVHRLVAVVRRFCSTKPWIRRLISDESIAGFALMVVLGVAFHHYTQNFPRIFDVELFDDTHYMGLGNSSAHLDFTNYESSPLYSLFYRIVSIFVGDSLRLYIIGGIVILYLAYIAEAIAIFILSGSAVLAVLISAIPVFSGVFVAATPRVSFLAILIISLGAAFALRFDRVSQKAAVLTVIAFLATFVRPEFVSAFYLIGAIAALSFLWELFRQLRGKRVRGQIFIHRNGVSLVSFAGVAVLSLAWSFPVLSDSARAFSAFGQHYSLRYVGTHGLTMNPWLLWQQVMAKEFPGAKTIGETFHVSPAKVLTFYAHNLGRLTVVVWHSLSETILGHPFFFAISLAVLIGGIVWRLGTTRPSFPDEPVASTPRHKLLMDLMLIAILGSPPLLGCILVFPRSHYIIMVELAAYLLVARALRGSKPTLAPIFAVAVGIGFILAIKPLPVVDQPTVRIVETLRGLPPVRGMIEADGGPGGGWCIYLQPRCATYFVTVLPPQATLQTMLKDGTINAILVSPRMANYEKDHPDPVLSFLFDGSQHPEWTSHLLTNGFSVFYRLPEDGTSR
jgi:hypothetical protein